MSITEAINESAAPETEATTETVNNEFMSGVGEDFKEYAANQGFDSLDAVISAHKDLQHQVGHPQHYMRIPKEDDVKGWEDVYTKLGAAKDAEELGLGEDFNDFAADAVKASLTKTQANKLKELNIERSNSIIEQSKQEFEALEAKWGDKKEAFIEKAKLGAKSLGLEQEDLAAVEQALGTTKFMELLIGSSKHMQEATFTDGASSVASDIKQQFAEFKANNAEKLVKGDKWALQERSRLFGLMEKQGIDITNLAY